MIAAVRVTTASGLFITALGLGAASDVTFAAANTLNRLAKRLT